MLSSWTVSPLPAPVGVGDTDRAFPVLHRCKVVKFHDAPAISCLLGLAGTDIHGPEDRTGRPGLKPYLTINIIAHMLAYVNMANCTNF